MIIFFVPFPLIIPVKWMEVIPIGSTFGCESKRVSAWNLSKPLLETVVGEIERGEIYLKMSPQIIIMQTFYWSVNARNTTTLRH